MELTDLLKTPFNLLLGAGVSKAYPSNAPLWYEMCDGLLTSMADKIVSERWPAYDTKEQSDAYLSILRNYDFRPEHFWQVITNEISLDFTVTCFRALSSGKPNLNHFAISHLLISGLVSNVFTTNFDEYIENCLPNDFKIVATLDQAKECLDGGLTEGIVIKPHGTLSRPSSMIFTLRDTISLSESMVQLIQAALKGKPLVIAGYSGNDDDLMPVIKELAQNLPLVVVCQYPGAIQREPIAQLSGRNVVHIQTDINIDLPGMADSDGTFTALFTKGALSQEQPTENEVQKFRCFTDAVSSTPAPILPYVLSVLLRFTGNETAALSLGVLALDACDDSRYSGIVPADLRHRILVHLNGVCATVNDSFFSEIVKQELVSAPLGVVMAGELNRVYGLLCQPNLSAPEESDIEETLTGIYKWGDLFCTHDISPQFYSLWYLGRLRRRQGRLTDATAAYEQAEEVFAKDSRSQLTRFVKEIGHSHLAAYYLDAGWAIWCHAFELKEEGRGVSP